jgi:hypothetical protein
VPLHFAPGEAFQFDWSEDWAIIAVRTKLQMAHIKLSHSRAFIVRAYPLQTHEMLFDAHNSGVPGAGRRAAARDLRQHEDRGRPGRRGKERQINARFAAMASHYLFEPEFCNPASGWEKGRSRRTSRTPAIGCGRRCPLSPILRR